MRLLLDVNVNVTYMRGMSKHSHVKKGPRQTPKLWGIQDLANAFDITPRAIRFYEDKGLLAPRREAGARVFSETDFARLERILRAKRLGFTLDDIKIVMDVTDGLVTDRQELMSRRESFRGVIMSLKKRRKDIEQIVGEMGELCAAIDTHLENSSSDDGVFYLANAYQAAFGEEFADEELIEIRD